MGNYVPGKYFEETHGVEHSKFEIEALMQTVNGSFDKCVKPGFEEETVPTLSESERRCVLEYIRTRKAFDKKFRQQFENKMKESFEAKEKKQNLGNSM
eukprot:TRINITY_DN1699_c2_g2_i1.p1 TRINITY_DN1699_c2_g2~~TRINITY_DN1699_c2_g2_i1.p1  ORF type:complete len:114 (+),score=29.19 TRINITY_DN1699_c2_g2_i1:51-344(+)